VLELFRGSGMRRSLFAAAVTAWLLDHDWFRIIPNRWVESPMAYPVIPWIPGRPYVTNVLGSFGGFLGFLERRAPVTGVTSPLRSNPLNERNGLISPVDDAPFCAIRN
jgi:hypothetical protein